MGTRGLASVKRAVYVIFIALSAGCSADTYQRWADHQVEGIVNDREQHTLGYKPQVVAPTDVPTTPPPGAYAKVPDTPKPPPATAPIEPGDLKLPYGPLGPEQIFPSGVTSPQAENKDDVSLLAESNRAVLGPPAPGKQILRIDLFGSLRYGVLHARDYQSRMEDLYLSALNVTLQRHLFEPTPFASTGLEYDGGQENANYAAALTAANRIGIKQKLPYGGEVAAQAAVNFVRAISGNAQSGENATATISASIPLLRGAGIVNLEPLIQSERDMVYTVRQFEEFRRNFVVDIATSYFRLLAAQQAIANRAANLTSFEQLTARTQALYAAGRLNYIDVQRALQEQLQAQQDLISAERSYRSALDDYKLSLGMPVDEPLEVVAQELAVNVPQYQEKEVATLAQKYRLDLRTAADRVEDAQRGVQVAKNGLLPDFDLTAQAGFGSNPGTAAVNINNDQTTYSAAATLDLPLDRVAERNAYRRSLIELERAQRNYVQLQDQVAANARDSLRQIEQAQISLEIQRKGIELAQLTLENANELLRQGKKDSKDAVDAQNALLRAQDQYEQARAQLQIQVLSFLRDTGTLRADPEAGAIGASLDRKSVAVNEPPVAR